MYTIIDIETTGNGIKGNKITEIAIFKFDGTQVIDEFVSLVNPQCDIPYFITGLTGIDNDMVRNAPTFEMLALKILEITENTIFVAHSVNFDFGVIREEFRQLGIEYARKKLCTVRLSRKLIPGLRSYSLGKLCTAVGISINNRHRAFGDAKATVHLFKLLLEKPTAKQMIKNFLNARSREATLPPLLPKKVMNDLPEKPGIYFFRDSTDTIIYVGKANNIRKRVWGHFYDKSNKETRLCREIASIDFELSGSELMALLLESAAIKKHFPKYNRAQKQISRSFGIFQYEDRNGFIHLAYGSSKTVKNPIKTFYRQSDCTLFLRTLCDKHGLCEKYCHLRQIACDDMLCHGACKGNETATNYNERVQLALSESMVKGQSLVIEEKGRNKNEAALISILDGEYQGYAFVDKNEQLTSFETLEVHLTRQKNTWETDSIIAAYLLRKGTKNVKMLSKMMEEY